MNKPLALCVMLLAAIVPHAANGGQRRRKYRYQST